ncbi:hypothetical protein FRC03_012353 [Tulasnella sp. 419]|nr:hypothetical protein FRC03_012353 [Tulasnella sp. 419]
MTVSISSPYDHILIDSAPLAWIITALSTRTHQTIAELQSSFQCEPLDTTNTKWIDDWTVFIPISRQGIVIRWTFHGDNAVPNEPLIIQPIEAVAHHYLLRYDGTEDGAWWTVTGISWGGGPPSGAIEVRDVVNAESRIVEGMASCIAEVEVYDRKKALLISVNLGSGAKLQLSVQQVNPTEPGQPFIPVETEVDFLNQNDFPTVVYVLHPLPIVAVVTSEQYIYFFELHTGAHLYAFDPNPCETWWRQSDPRGVLIWKNAQRTIHRVSVNERDLIRYCRLVLKDDILASGIAIRTGLSGAEDVAFHEMHNYQTSS